MISFRRARAIPLLIGLLFVTLVAVLAIAMAQGVGSPAQGRSGGDLGTAPAFELDQFDGQRFVLAEYSERPVFVYFWASWCVPCELEAPLIEKLWPEYRDRGWTFLGVNIWDAETDARRFIERHRLSFPTARDEGGKVYLEYGVQGLPTAFFINPGQQIYARFDGPLSENTLRGLLEDASVASSTPPSPSTR